MLVHLIVFGNFVNLKDINLVRVIHIEHFAGIAKSLPYLVAAFDIVLPVILAAYGNVTIQKVCEMMIHQIKFGLDRETFNPVTDNRYKETHVVDFQIHQIAALWKPATLLASQVRAILQFQCPATELQFRNTEFPEGAAGILTSSF